MCKASNLLSWVYQGNEGWVLSWPLMVREQLCGSAAILHPDHGRACCFLKDEAWKPTGLRTLFQRPRVDSVGPRSTALHETDSRTRIPSAAFPEGPQHMVSKRPVRACSATCLCLQNRQLMSISKKCLYCGLFLKWNSVQPVKMNEW